jgi:hypothetical protein
MERASFRISTAWFIPKREGGCGLRGPGYLRGNAETHPRPELLLHRGRRYPISPSVLRPEPGKIGGDARRILDRVLPHPEAENEEVVVGACCVVLERYRLSEFLLWHCRPSAPIISEARVKADANGQTRRWAAQEKFSLEPPKMLQQ